MRNMTTSTADFRAAGPAHAAPPVDVASTQYRGMLYILFAYLIINYARPHDLFPPLAAAHPGLLLSVALVPFALLKFTDPVFKDTGIRCMMAFIGLGVLSIVYGLNYYWAFQETKQMAMYLLCVVVPLGLLITNMARLRQLIWLWLLLHCFVAAYAISNGGVGPGSFLLDENDLALALLMAVPYAYFLQKSTGVSKKMRLVLIFSVILLLAGVVATMSRGGFVGLAVMTAAIAFMSRNKIRNALLLCVAGALFYVFMPEEYKTEVESIGDIENSTRVERLNTWIIGWDMFVDNPIIGVGVGNFRWRIGEYQAEARDVDNYRNLSGRAAHSVYFTLLPETGLVGTILVAWLILHIIKRQREAIRLSSRPKRTDDTEFIDACARATLVSLAGFLGAGTFISVLYFPELWYALGFSYVIHRVAVEQAQDPAT